jgi:hypothetical protein
MVSAAFQAEFVPCVVRLFPFSVKLELVPVRSVAQGLRGDLLGGELGLQRFNQVGGFVSVHRSPLSAALAANLLWVMSPHIPITQAPP